jgi:D-arabinose 1-dehydrogenase-like Zn-dependent alcohol dehydrogenase
MMKMNQKHQKQTSEHTMEGAKTMSKMMAAYLPGNSSVILKEVDIPEPGHGQVLIRTKSSTICGSDIRAIYREHLGKGPEGYQNKIAGHEPAGQIVRCGPGMRRFKEGDRVILYHISGCGLCLDCRMGYMISCTSPLRAAYGWQRDGGMAPYILAEEKDCVPLPDELTYTDGAQALSMKGSRKSGFPAMTPFWSLAWARLAWRP